MEEVCRAGCVGRGRGFCALWHVIFPEFPCVHQPMSYLNPVPLSFYGGFISKVDYISSHWRTNSLSMGWG